MRTPGKCRLFHRWREIGWDGWATLLDECEKCRWQRAWHGFLNEAYIYPPGTYKQEGAGQ